MKLAVVPLLLWGHSLAAQHITLVAPSEITQQRRLLEQAWQDWETADAGLERRLFTEPVERVLARIERSRRLAIAYHQQRARFLESVLRALEGELAQLEESHQQPGPSLLGPDPRKLDVLLEEQKRLESRARAAGLSVLEQRWQAEQSAVLRQLADNIAAQQALYEAFREGEEQNRKARRALVESYRRLSQLLEQQLRLNEEKRQLWLEYYDSLRQLLEAGQPKPTVPKAAKAGERK